MKTLLKNIPVNNVFYFKKIYKRKYFKFHLYFWLIHHQPYVLYRPNVLSLCSLGICRNASGDLAFNATVI